MHREFITPTERFDRHAPEHQHFIFEGMEWPATREDLVNFANEAELDVDTLNLVRSLPDRTYDSVDDVWRSIGEASRRFGVGARGGGTPRDDIGKQATVRKSGKVNRP